GRNKAGVTFTLPGSRALPVRVDVVRAGDGEPVWSRRLPSVTAGRPTTVRWSGLVARRAAPEGRYEFKLAVGSAASSSAGAGASSAGSFRF
ncbi:hypothetical protein OFO30_31730, partial [Escherichia coli]|nr:hypothetical protein [Escherichia coli]